MSTNLSLFTNPADVSSYVQDAPKKVPGLADLHRMAAILLAERTQEAAHMLVVGAGGGLELSAMAGAQPGWRFTGVDPSPAMLEIARHTVAPYAERIDLLEGTVDYAPPGPFDGATCLLTLHFLSWDERLELLMEVRRRLAPGSALVTAHHSKPDNDPARWLARSVSFSRHTGSHTRGAEASAKMMVERLSLLSAEEEQALLREAGFVEPTLFYAAFSFRGWVAVSP